MTRGLGRASGEGGRVWEKREMMVVGGQDAMLHPPNLLSSSTCCNVLCLCGRECHNRLQLAAPTDSSRSHFDDIAILERLAWCETMT